MDFKRWGLSWDNGFPSALVEDAPGIGLGEVTEVAVRAGSAPAADLSVFADAAVSFELFTIPDRLEDRVIMPDV